jgi:hypothetical protein
MEKGAGISQHVRVLIGKSILMIMATGKISFAAEAHGPYSKV